MHERLAPTGAQKLIAIIGIVVLTIMVVVFWWFIYVSPAKSPSLQPVTQPVTSAETPIFTTQTVVSGREHVWDIGFLPDGDMLFTERGGVLSGFKNGQTRQIAKIADVNARGESGLMGLAIDPLFVTNRYIYTCFSTKNDVRVVRWQLAADGASIANRNDIITGMVVNQSGRHAGCRIVFGPDDYLWVGTGDAALGDDGIQPKSLGGKILRVNRDGAAAASGNVGGEYDARVYSYGHRNTQGLAFFSAPRAGVVGLSAEHGSYVDDEINPLTKGNFGWAPPKGYNETGVPMTDKKRFPDAIDALWSSGEPTQAPAGATIINGRLWKGWDGALAVVMLKGQHLKILRFDEKLAINREEKVLTNFGRLRAVIQGSDGDLYIGTSNGGGQDQIIRLTPS